MQKRYLIASLLLFPLFLLAYTSPGKPAGFVNDFAQMLGEATVSNLNTRLASYAATSGHEIAVVTIPRLEDETIETYAVKLFEEWGIGNESEDNGLLLLISREDRGIRIEVGYGLEPEVTDIESSYIIQDALVPAFQAGKFDEGVTQAVEAIIASINTEVTPPAKAGGINWSGDLIYLIFFAIMFLGSILARSKSWWAGGVLGAIIGWVFFSGLIAIGILGIIGLLFDFIVSRRYKKSRDDGTNPPWWIGGGGIGGRGGGGFGGFGGGMSGGGGASGRW